GQGVYNKENEVEAIEGLIIDISERRKREEEINYMSYHDALTGLYNRRFFDEEKLRLDNEDYYPLTVIIGDINGVKFVNSALGHQEGDKLIAKMAQILISSCRDGDVLARTGGDEFSILLPKTGYEEAYSVIRQISKLREEENKLNEEENKLNETFNHSISLGCATKNSKEESFSSIIKEAEESMYRHKLLQNKSLHSSIISSMKSSLYEKSQETEEHAQRLIELSKGIGESMNLLEEQLNELELLSTLHDIGKIGISDGILNKPDKLNPSEWEEMKRHPEMGYRIAMSTPELAPIADYILCHHERWDGSGYPQGLKGEDIPLLSRIISIADSYDAMTSDRSYRKAMPKEDALNEIRRNSGSQFDPKIVEIFLGNLVKDA
ncbi:MAG TPA: HD domain-containing phosphohydrolase, partial [Mobilitalea sp.]|nr:HD domain-containing phosphohydrolase [Mobilitalea sp.]